MFGNNSARKTNGLSADFYTQVGPALNCRFVRTKPSSTLTADDILAQLNAAALLPKEKARRKGGENEDEVEEEEEEEDSALGGSTDRALKVEPVRWLEHFFVIRGSNARVYDMAAYQSGELYGIDASSGAAVQALDVQPGHHCLDLCCAPGAKLAMMADLLDGKGSVTGVDVSSERLSACCSVVRKYRLSNVRLFLGDARKFDAPPSLLPTCSNTGREAQRHQKKLKTKHVATAERTPELFFHTLSNDRRIQHEPAPSLYDRVLADVECTHDGSVKHICKFKEWGWDTFEKRFLDPARINTLIDLQRDILIRGFAMLRPGGKLVYSTCSLTRAQNEGVMNWFLEKEPSAKLIPANQSQWPAQPAGPGHPPTAYRFDPRHGETGGLYIAVVTK